ncbi:MAG: hypothetical protein N5P05_004256 (plasmid) [Chroococcopsis gigantea SAG 12.99]|jgi:hypothetical protein|nr:hypothetical protein [Chroococcopsis gigantea SAG 12.99]
MSANIVEYKCIKEALEWLNTKLYQAVLHSQELYSGQAINDPYQGLYIHPLEIELLLSHGLSNPLIYASKDNLEEELKTLYFFSYLNKLLSLSHREISLVLIALAPEIDLTYEKLYAYLQNDITRKRPTLDFALNLLCTSPEEKQSLYSSFNNKGILQEWHILELSPPSHQSNAPFLAYEMRLSQSFLNWLLGGNIIGNHLKSFVSFTETVDSLTYLPVEEKLKQSLLNLLQKEQIINLYFYQSHGYGQEILAGAIANHTGQNLLSVNLHKLLLCGGDIESIGQRIFLICRLYNALLYLDGLDELLSPEGIRSYHLLFSHLKTYQGRVIISGKKFWNPPTGSTGWVAFPCSLPDARLRLSYWREKLATVDHRLSSEELETLADRFQLTHEQIDRAVHTARNQTLCQGNDDPITLETLFVAARS